MADREIKKCLPNFSISATKAAGLTFFVCYIPGIAKPMKPIFEDRRARI
jgi:hypothetical protein